MTTIYDIIQAQINEKKRQAEEDRIAIVTAKQKKFLTNQAESQKPETQKCEKKLPGFKVVLERDPTDIEKIVKEVFDKMITKNTKDTKENESVRNL